MFQFMNVKRYRARFLNKDGRTLKPVTVYAPTLSEAKTEAACLVGKPNINIIREIYRF